MSLQNPESKILIDCNIGAKRMTMFVKDRTSQTLDGVYWIQKCHQPELKQFFEGDAWKGL